jgi:hypothetical protein
MIDKMRRKKHMRHDRVDEGLASAGLQAAKSLARSKAGQRVAAQATKVGTMARNTRAAYKRNPAAFKRLARMKVKAVPRALNRKHRIAKVAIKRSKPGMKVRAADRFLNRRYRAKETARAALRRTNPVRAGINDTTREISRDIATGVATTTGTQVAMHHVGKKLPREESYVDMIRPHLWEVDNDFSPKQMGDAVKKYRASKTTQKVKTKTQFGSHHIDNAHVAHLRSGHMTSKKPSANAFKLNQKTKTNVSDDVIDMADVVYEAIQFAPLAIGAAKMVGSAVATDAAIKGGSKVVNKVKGKKTVKTEAYDAFNFRGHKTVGKPQQTMDTVKAGLAVGATVAGARYAGKKLAGTIMKRDAATAKNAERAHASDVKRLAKKIKANPQQVIRNRLRMHALKSSAKKRNYAAKMYGKAVKRVARKEARIARKNEKLKKRLARVTTSRKEARIARKNEKLKKRLARGTA